MFKSPNLITVQAPPINTYSSYLRTRSRRMELRNQNYSFGLSLFLFLSIPCYVRYL